MQNGILVIDKPAGMSSAQVVGRIKRLLKPRKIGHTGTLDPFATGVLVCCLNHATRLSGFFLHGTKSYEAVLRLGITTDTLDLTGTVTEEHPLTGVTPEAIEAAFAGFRGDIRQKPPAYSALKHKGVPLYKLARKGITVEKPPRDVTISRLEILDIQGPDVRFAISCSGGTYIRTLAADIGAILGCGAHLIELRRTASSHFTIADALPLENLEAAAGELEDRLISMSRAVNFFPVHVAGEDIMRKITYGQPLTRSDLPWRWNDGDYLRVTDAKDCLLALLCCKKSSDIYDYCCVLTP